MSYNSHMDRLIFQIAELKRQVGSGAQRKGYVKEVKEASGERKMRVVMGFRPDGSELLSPWLPADDHSGGSQEQQLYEKGQNVTVNSQGNDFRQASVSPDAQSKSFPQPQHASKVNGDSRQAGKAFKATHKPKEDSGGSSGGSGGGSSGGGENSNHFHATGIFKEAKKNPKHQDQQSAPMGQSSGGGGQSSSSQGGQQGGGQDSNEAAMMHRVDEKGGITSRVGKDHRVVAHEKGAKIKSGDENWVVSSKEENKVIVRSQEPPWVSDAWIIKKKKDPIPDDNAEVG